MQSSLIQFKAAVYSLMCSNKGNLHAQSGEQNHHEISCTQVAAGLPAEPRTLIQKSGLPGLDLSSFFVLFCFEITLLGGINVNTTFSQV